MHQIEYNKRQLKLKDVGVAWVSYKVRQKYESVSIINTIIIILHFH